MSKLTMTLTPDKTGHVKAETVLRSALDLLSMLRGIERSMTGKRRSTTRWTVDIKWQKEAIAIEFDVDYRGDGVRLEGQTIEAIIAKIKTLEEVEKGMAKG